MRARPSPSTDRAHVVAPRPTLTTAVVQPGGLVLPCSAGQGSPSKLVVSMPQPHPNHRIHRRQRHHRQHCLRASEQRTRSVVGSAIHFRCRPLQVSAWPPTEGVSPSTGCLLGCFFALRVFVLSAKKALVGPRHVCARFSPSAVHLFCKL